MALTLGSLGSGQMIFWEC